MQFPDEAVLIARGKYSTLSAKRRDQLERVQNICRTLVTEAQAALRDCEAKPPINGSHVEAVVKCYENLKDARAQIIEVSNEMIDIEPEAWPK